MHARSRFTLRIALATGLVITAAARPAGAQQSLAPSTPRTDVAAPEAPAPAPTPAPEAKPAGPTMDAASVAVRAPVTHETRAPNAAPRRAGYGQPVALIVVGSAALLTGPIIGGGAGTAIAVGGAVVGLYGLYEFLQ